MINTLHSSISLTLSPIHDNNSSSTAAKGGCPFSITVLSPTLHFATALISQQVCTKEECKDHGIGYPNNICSQFHNAVTVCTYFHQLTLGQKKTSAAACQQYHPPHPLPVDLRCHCHLCLGHLAHYHHLV